MRKRKLNRRGFLRLSAEFATGVLVAACAPKVVEKEAPAETVVKETAVVEKEATAAPAGQTEILWWTGHGGSIYENAYVPVAKAFEEANPDLKLNLVSVGDGLFEKILTAVAAGNPPDLSENLPYGELFARGACIPLTEWINESTVIDRASGDVPEAYWKMFSWQGEIYGVPGMDSAMRECLVYNIDIVKEAGLDPDNPPQTWDELFEWHKATTKFDAAGNAVIVGFEPLNAMAGSIGSGDPWMWPPSWGLDYWDEDGVKFNLDGPELAEFFRTIKMFYDHVGVEQMEAIRTNYEHWEGPGAAFPSGVQAMQITGPWAPAELAHNAPDRHFAYTYIPVPASRKGKKIQVLGGQASIMFKGAKHPQEAFRLVEFFQTKVAMDIFYTGGLGLGCRTSWLKTMDTSEFVGMDFFVNSVTECDELWGMEADPIVGVTDEEFTKAADAVNYGDKTPEQAAQDMSAALAKALQELVG